MEPSEKRVHTRAQYFLVHRDQDYVGVFALRSNDAPRDIPALIVDVSEGGLQVLCGPAAAPQQTLYRLELAAAQADASGAVGSWRVRSIWCKPDGMYIRSGLSFEAAAERGPDLVALLGSSEHQLLRCVLRPLD